MNTHFTLEDAIMASWQTASDIDTLLGHYGDHTMTEDEIMNALIGISALHEMRMSKLFSVFEDSLKKD